MSSLAWGGSSVTAHDASVLWPALGSIRADVVLVSGSAPPVGAAATLTLVDLDVVGTVETSSLDAPDRPRVIVRTGLGWDRAIGKAISYESNGGVRLSTVLRDLARIAGEKIVEPADLIIGVAWGCDAACGSRSLRVRDALAALTRSGYLSPWRADPDGVTRFGSRVGVPVTARATVMRRDAAAGLTVVGLDSPAAFAPGGSVEDVAFSRVVLRDAAGKLEGDLYR